MEIDSSSTPAPEPTGTEVIVREVGSDTATAVTRVIKDDYVVITDGDMVVTNVQSYASGTTVITVRRKSGSNKPESVEVGQVWKDADPRMAHRGELTVVEIKDGRAAVVESGKKHVSRRISVRRMLEDSSRGYTFVRAGKAL